MARWRNKEGSENNPGIIALKEVLESSEMAEFINQNYEGAVIPFN